MSKPKEEPKRDVIKSSAAIHIHNSITLLQRRVWNVLLFNAYNELEKKEEHQIALKDLSTLVGYDSHDMDYLKEAAEAMVRCTVQWDILDKDGSPEQRFFGGSLLDFDERSRMKPKDYRNRKSSLKSYSHGICGFTFCASNFSGRFS